MFLKILPQRAKFFFSLITLILFFSLTLNIYLAGKLAFPWKEFFPFLAKNKQEEIVEVVKVIDGDTFETKDGERVRFAEIDAPEYPAGCLGLEAKNRLEALILNKKVSLEKLEKDNFGRILAYVYQDKLFLNQALVEEGLAYFYKQRFLSPYSLEIEKAQTKAKLAGRGVWSTLCQSQKEGCLIKGNYRPSDTTRLYHTPNCYNYERITVKPGTSDRWFCSEEEAQAAGFLKSQDCPK